MDRGLLKTGRSLSIEVELVDKPGQLKGVSDILAEEGANVTLIHHEKATEDTDINGAYLRITMETKNFEHIEEIKKRLTDAGFHFRQY